MEMDAPPLIHNSTLRGTNTSKTNRIGGGGEEDERSRARQRGDVSEEIGGLSTLPRVMKIQSRLD